jgi:hypothetical protein
MKNQVLASGPTIACALPGEEKGGYWNVGASLTRCGTMAIDPQ